MKYRIAAVSLLAILLGACETPLVTPRGPSFQYKITHAAHWESLASRTAGSFASTASGGEVYVAAGPADMPFAVAYKKLLEQELQKRNVRIAQTAMNATVLRFDVQAFWYTDARQKYPVDYATFWTTAYAIEREARHVSSLDTGAAIVAGAGPVVDVLGSLFDTTNAEIILTLTATQGTQLTHRDTETFYVRPGELTFYISRVPDFVPQTKFAVGEDFALPVRDVHQ